MERIWAAPAEPIIFLTSAPEGRRGAEILPAPCGAGGQQSDALNPVTGGGSAEQSQAREQQH